MRLFIITLLLLDSFAASFNSLSSDCFEDSQTPVSNCCLISCAVQRDCRIASTAPRSYSTT
ncbi:MAG: hypothetical protein JWN70_1923 [Planctomycetaceae bacterium]|nr:hypothetical protein [Planctomycetaceae bacterium]